jgi:hypothetical protein
MRTVCYVIISILVAIIVYDFFKIITLREGLDNPPQNSTNREKLWKDNANMITTLNHDLSLLNTDLDNLENLAYIRENTPELLGARVNDESLNMNDVIQYFKSGIDENKQMLKDIEERAKNAIPKEENVNISGV